MEGNGSVCQNRMSENLLLVYVGFLLFVATVFVLVARGHMEGCILFIGSILGGIVNYFLYSVAIFLITEPFVEDGTEKYNGLVMTYRPSYEQYVYRLTGLKGKADAHEITPLAPIIGGPDGKVVTFSLNE